MKYLPFTRALRQVFDSMQFLDGHPYLKELAMLISSAVVVGIGVWLTRKAAAVNSSVRPPDRFPAAKDDPLQ